MVYVPSGTFNSKLPSKSADAPMVVPTTPALAAKRGSAFSSSMMAPLMNPSCAKVTVFIVANKNKDKRVCKRVIIDK